MDKIMNIEIENKETLEKMIEINKKIESHKKDYLDLCAKLGEEIYKSRIHQERQNILIEQLRNCNQKAAKLIERAHTDGIPITSESYQEESYQDASFGDN
jgi:hypothetical protein